MSDHALPLKGKVFRGALYFSDNVLLSMALGQFEGKQVEVIVRAAPPAMEPYPITDHAFVDWPWPEEGERGRGGANPRPHEGCFHVVSCGRPACEHAEAPGR